MPLDPHAFALARTFEERNGLQIAELNKLARRLSGETFATIADGSLTEPKYATDSVSQRALAPDSVTAAEIQNGTVGSAEIADGSVTNFELAGGVALQNIGSGGIGSGYLAGGAALGNIGAGGISSTYLAGGAATVYRAVAGTTSSPSAGGYATVPEMSIVGDFGGNPVFIMFSTTITGASGSMVDLVVNDGSSDIGHSLRRWSIPPSGWESAVVTCPHTPGAGSRTITIKATLAGGNVTFNGVQRNLTIIELRR